jgi:D-beta-D-heptose 7-phosphate kinase/D-beta-D-heptose 1-phosphate adenosyltransferase
MSQFTKILDKISTVEDTLQWIEEKRKAGKIIGFTNGCFDILHRGHVTYLAKASDHADYLVLGLNADESVRRQGKGPERPINNEESRAIVVASLSSIDRVVIFKEDTPELLIELLQPDVLIKGADYDAEETNPKAKRYIVGSKSIREKGGRIITIPLVEGHSTTGLVKKLKD